MISAAPCISINNHLMAKLFEGMYHKIYFLIWNFKVDPPGHSHAFQIRNFLSKEVLPNWLNLGFAFLQNCDAFPWYHREETFDEPWRLKIKKSPFFFSVSSPGKIIARFELFSRKGSTSGWNEQLVKNISMSAVTNTLPHFFLLSPSHFFLFFSFLHF